MPGRPARLRGWAVRHQRAGRRLGIVLIGCAVGGVIYLNHQRVIEGLTGFAHLRPSWVALSVLAELLSMITFGMLQKRLLAAGGEQFGLRSVLAIAYPANALSVFVPYVGSTMAAGLTLRRMQRARVDPVIAGTTLVLSGVVSTSTFGLIVMIAAAVSGQVTAGIASAVGGGILVLVAIAVALTLRHPDGRNRLTRLGVGTLRRVRRIMRQPARSPEQVVRDAMNRMRAFHIGPAVTIESVGWATVNWLANAGALILALQAAHAPVPWRSIWLIWGVVPGIAAVSPIPAGIGIIDVSLTAALAGSGVPTGQAITAVLLYRLVSFQVVATMVWAVIGVRQRRRSAPQPAA